MSPKSNDNCPYKRQKRIRHRKAQDHVKAEAEIGVMKPTKPRDP